MESLSIDTIIALITLLLGGGGIGAVFTWRWQRKKAKSEAKEVEAISEKAKYESVQAATNVTREVQDRYQQLIADINSDRLQQREYIEDLKHIITELKDDRRNLRQENAELRNRVEKVEKNQYDLNSKVARYGRMVESLRPMLCGREGCPNRMLVTISAEGTLSPSAQSPTQPTQPINPIPPVESHQPTGKRVGPRKPTQTDIDPCNEL